MDHFALQPAVVERLDEPQFILSLDQRSPGLCWLRLEEPTIEIMEKVSMKAPVELLDQKVGLVWQAEDVTYMGTVLVNCLI